MKYQEFIRSKIEKAPISGFEISDDELSDNLLPHQRDIVKWLIRGGRRALFASFGLGKTVIELEYCRIVCKHTGGKALIVVPLGVKQEFTHDAVELLGLGKPPYVRNQSEIEKSNADIMITNYERVRDGDIDPRYFMAISLDEASVLRSFGSKVYQTFLNKFKGVKYKIVATATPSPNKYKELIHYAGFLEIMDTGQALTRFFKRDSTKANKLTLMETQEDEFWMWMGSWATFITKPSDIDQKYSDEGYDLPEMDIRFHCLQAEHEALMDKKGNYMLFLDAAGSLQDAAKIKRDSMKQRINEAKNIIENDPQSNFVIWHELEDERKELKKAIPNVVDIYGSMDLDEREKRVIDFSEGRTRLFTTKKSMSGSGCNFQRHCHRAIFLGIDYKFNDFIQAIHRIYRFLQEERVIVDVIYTDEEENIKEELMRKWKQHNHLVDKMIAIVHQYGLSNIGNEAFAKRKVWESTVKIEEKTFTAVNGDCVEVTTEMEDNSIDLIHTSIPFSNHYEYTPTYNDFGHNKNTYDFFKQMDFLTPQLLRILKPGRVAAIHVKDRVLFGNATGTGMPTMEPFHAMCIQHYMKHGFQYFGMITVVTDVVRENNQTYRLGWSEQCKDGSKMGVGCPEYILLFRKLPSDTNNAYADIPVAKSKEEYTRARWQIDAHGYWRSSGDRMMSKDEIMMLDISKLQKAYRIYSRNTVYDYAQHREMAEQLDENGKLPASFMVVAPGSWNDKVWDDINRMRTLNADQSRRKLQMHICPLQLDIVERIINRYSNPGDVVMDPFGGLFTVPMMAIKMNRKGYGIELSQDYFRDGVGYCRAAQDEKEMPTLFDLCGINDVKG